MLGFVHCTILCILGCVYVNGGLPTGDVNHSVYFFTRTNILFTSFGATALNRAAQLYKNMSMSPQQPLTSPSLRFCL